MSDDYQVRMNDMALISRIAQISSRIDDLSPLMLAIGETLTESTKERFSTSTAPDGQKWKKNADSTVLARLNKISGAYTKSGKLSKKGTAALTNKKPLVDSGLLQDTFRYQLANQGNSVEIGTDRFSGEWDGGAAIFHFGSRDGSIVPREIVGLSVTDRRDVIDILNAFGEQAVGK